MKSLTRSPIQLFLPLLELLLERKVDNRIELVRVALDQTEIQYALLLPPCRRAWPCTVGGLVLAILAGYIIRVWCSSICLESLVTLDVFKRFLEVVLLRATVLGATLLLNKFERAEPQPAFLVCLAEQSNWLSFLAQTPNCIFI